MHCLTTGETQYEQNSHRAALHYTGLQGTFKFLFPQLKLSHPKVKEGSSEEEELETLTQTKVKVLWQKVRKLRLSVSYQDTGVVEKVRE